MFRLVTSRESISRIYEARHGERNRSMFNRAFYGRHFTGRYVIICADAINRRVIKERSRCLSKKLRWTLVLAV